MADDRDTARCRICCDGPPTVPLFSAGDDENLAQIMSNFAGVPVLQDDGRSAHICDCCAQKLQTSVAFQKQIQNAEKVLEAMNDNVLSDVCTEEVIVKTEAVEEDPCEYEFLEDNTSSVDPLEKDNGIENQEKRPFSMPDRSRIAKHIEFETFEYLEIDGERCCGCNFIAADEDELVKHSKATHSQNYYPDSSYTCPTCYQKFQSQEKLTSHIEYYSFSDIFVCKSCNGPFVQKSDIMTHLQNCSLPQFSPEVQEFTKKPTNRRKLSPATRTEKVSSDLHPCCFVRCWEVFESPEELTVHVEHVHDSKRRENVSARLRDAQEATVICQTCQRWFNSESNLLQHKSYKQQREQHPCQKCPAIFYKLPALRDHVLSRHHDKPPNHECETCGKTFSKLAVLKNHKRIHTPFEGVPCSEPGCKLVFRDKALMKRHCRNVHGDNFPWECQYCPKKVRTKEAMDLHVRAHTGEKPYSCRQGCDRKFAHATDRARHERSVHTGVRPHQCEQCSATYLRRRDLLIHINRVHQTAEH